MTDLILVDDTGKDIGAMEKMEAHRKGSLHRAISVFVFHTDGRVMLQKRASHKYHSGGLWANTCCSHPVPGESAEAVAHRRLKEEMGIECELKEVGAFTYRTEFSNGLIENEFDHVFVGVSSVEPILNPEEAEDWRWQDIASLQEEIHSQPERFAFWLSPALDVALKFHPVAIV